MCLCVWLFVCLCVCVVDIASGCTSHANILPVLEVIGVQNIFSQMLTGVFLLLLKQGK